MKQLLFQSQHRGFAELDLLLGTFARAHLAQLSVAELDAYEKLLNAQDWDVYAWLVGQTEPPAEHAVIVDVIKRSGHGY
ncbi:MAG: succinate dehydrogenase assembly factor 2 [Bdellovibrionales bacterium]